MTQELRFTKEFQKSTMQNAGTMAGTRDRGKCCRLGGNPKELTRKGPHAGGMCKYFELISSSECKRGGAGERKLLEMCLKTRKKCEAHFVK